MEAGEHGLRTRGTRFVANRLEVEAVAGLLWISWCVLGAAGFRGGGFRFFFFERTQPAASMRSPGPIYLSTSTSIYQFKLIELLLCSIKLRYCS